MSRLRAHLSGIPVTEDTTGILKYNEMYPGKGMDGLAVGEVAHFLWRIRQLELNEECREAARRHIEATATRILGEPWSIEGR